MQTQKLSSTNYQSTFAPNSTLETFKVIKNPIAIYSREFQAVIEQKRGSGRDEGQSHIQHGPCERCGSESQYFPLNHAGQNVYCAECERHNSSSSY